jgi:hypothetical protein
MEKKQFTFGMGGLGVLLGGLGYFLVSDRGRQIVRGISRHLEHAPDNMAQFADATQAELERIQETLDQIAARLHAVS